ncbi:hypothetical protein B484DRAFT_390923 [Ochromonadaceae sp. CCMP2298]|nr:hypothetical protein B484DRAFT_390923 [Ochromonadaceae sp. CCMP2298]
MGSIMAASSMGAVVPMPLPGLVSREVLGMTRLFGHKVTDRVALQVHGVDRGALLLRLAHCCAWQLLVAGVFNADPHAGNLIPPLARTPRRLYAHDGTDTHTHTHTDTHIHTHSGTGAQWGASDAGAGGEWGGAGGPGGGVGGGVECELVPGLLDFGMTVRLLPERRRAYCRLILALFDGDLVGAATELRGVGYLSNQSDRAPERDAEFFEFLFRDAHPTGVSSQERSAFNSKREAQKAADIAQGTREKGGRAIASMPEDFLLLTRLVGLLRGLTAELDASCPILQVLYEHAQPARAKSPPTGPGMVHLCRAIASMPEDFLLLTRLVGLLRGLTAELDASCPILQVLYEHAQII